ncbi:hypothetical protein ABZ135_31560 [Streptomyces sp. NPDC006339]|uniref:hypothetical protein n=1 Tax=Streptomyces sp. NPDC006339 TaxID=3156755 RepID=UPI0033B6D5CE
MPSDTPREQEAEHPVKKHVGWWIGTLSGLAGIVALLYAILGGSDGPSAGEWREKANAVCEQQLSDVNAKLRLSSEWAAHWARQTSTGQATQDDSRNTIHATRSAADTLKYLIGSLRAIDQPESMKDDIQKALNTGSDMTDGLNAAATGLERVDVAEASKHLTDVQAAIGPWQEQMRALRADRCMP